MSIHVSVVVPVYNAPLLYFEKCLDSLYAQTLSSVEFLIIFDGEQPEQESLCLKYQKNDNRFKLYHQKHQGVSCARNLGIKQAQGEYITFVDADDIIEKNCCNEVYSCAKKNNADVVLFDVISENTQHESCYFSTQSIDILNQKQIEKCQEQCIMLSDIKYIASVSTWCKLIRKDFILKNNIFFPESLKRCVDRPFSYKLFSTASKVSYINKSLYHYKVIEGSISNSYYENVLPIILSFLVEIKHFSTKHSVLIAQYAIGTFFSCWRTNYFIKENKGDVLRVIRNLSQITKSSWFKYITEDIDYKQLKPLIKIETYFFKHSITLPIWIHALKWKFFDKERN